MHCLLISKFCITKFGLKPGVVCKTPARNCVHFSVDAYDPIQYREAAKRLAEGDLTLPVRIGYPPRADYDCELILNFDAVYESGAELIQERSLRCHIQDLFRSTMAMHRSCCFQKFAHFGLG